MTTGRVLPPAAARGRAIWLLAGLGIAVAVGLLGIVRGSVEVPLSSVVRILLSAIPGIHVEADWPATYSTIVTQIRLPRVLVAGVVGATLSISGVTYQGLFRNPLADPYLIGVASGAGLGATIAIVSPWQSSLLGYGALPLMAFAGAMLAAGLAYSLARVGKTVPATGLILAGVAIAALASAATSFLMLTSRQDLRTVFSWLLGGFSTSSWDKLPVLLPYIVPAAVVMLLHARTLNAFQLDEEQAAQLGIQVERVKLLLIAAASLATAAAVSITGLIGFVGLIVPHTTRLIWGHDHRFLMPMSMALGAAYMIAADLIARTLIAPAEMPVGIITALCGAPFFLLVLRRRHVNLA